MPFTTSLTNSADFSFNLTSMSKRRQISLNVCAQKCGSKQIRNLAPFSTSLPTSAEECQIFKISLPHFEIENFCVYLKAKNLIECHYHLRML